MEPPQCYEGRGNYQGTEIVLTEDQVRKGSHQGQCDNDIEELLLEPEIAKQVAAWKPEALRKELKEEGAWDDIELQDDEQNKRRWLWIVCSTIKEESF